MNAAIVILSDPQSGSEESLGRLFNALASAYDFKKHGDNITLLFQGTGTRWLREVTKPDHPAYKMFEAVKDKVGGVSSGCADVFDATEDAEKSGFSLLDDNLVPGTNGLPSLQKLVAEGYVVLTF